MVRASIDQKRLLRLNAYKIVEGYRGTRDMPAMTEFYSLPFDEELIELEKQEMERVQSEAEEIYKMAREYGYFNNPIDN